MDYGYVVRDNTLTLIAPEIVAVRERERKKKKMANQNSAFVL